jgi:polar amino acid transport system permease protein
MRGTPLMLQLLVVYFGPYFIFGIPITRSYRLNAVLIGFALNYAAYFAEIYRGGISAIPEGQYEAAKLLGYSRSQTFIHIVMPQVVKRIIPAVANETITLVKDTSLAFTLAVAEIFTLTKQLVASQSSMMPFVVAAVFYYIFNLLVAMFFDHVEKKLSYYR